MNEQGKTLAEVDYDNPILIEAIGEETDVAAIMESLEDKPKALTTLAKAEKPGWQNNRHELTEGVTILLKRQENRPYLSTLLSSVVRSDHV